MHLVPLIQGLCARYVNKFFIPLVFVPDVSISFVTFFTQNCDFDCEETMMMIPLFIVENAT